MRLVYRQTGTQRSKPESGLDYGRVTALLGRAWISSVPEPYQWLRLPLTGQADSFHVTIGTRVKCSRLNLF